jgi:hypothetical protein
MCQNHEVSKGCAEVGFQAAGCSKPAATGFLRGTPSSFDHLDTWTHVVVRARHGRCNNRMYSTGDIFFLPNVDVSNRHCSDKRSAPLPLYPGTTTDLIPDNSGKPILTRCPCQANLIPLMIWGKPILTRWPATAIT